MPAQRVNLYLVGFMGTGKSTVARVVASRLGFSALDTDHEIEKRAGKPIARIFEEDGEPGFRKIERELVTSSLPATGVVVACGGGLVAQPGMLDELRSRGVVICLHASLETILKRTQGHSHRPLLNVADPAERIRALHAEREPVYRQAGTVILTDGRSLNEVAAHVMRVYRREADDWAKARR